MRPDDAPAVTESVTLPEDGPRRIHVREWALEVVGGPDKGKKVSTLGPLLRVGSDPSSDLVLTDSTVSRRHLEVERTQRGLLLRDLGSRNGSWVDGRQIQMGYLEPGDKLALGKTRLVVKQAARGTQIEIDAGDSFGELVGNSEAMQACFAELRRCAREDHAVLIEGETGTGKELAARAIHNHSLRRHGPFRLLDCAMVKAEQAQAELFGPEGGFTQAHNGTLFLDEVTELPAEVQALLLRAMETKELPGLNGGPVRPFHGRVIASTQNNLLEKVQAGEFRKDLYFRLAVGKVHLPPLRTRKVDLPVLSRALMQSQGVDVELTAQMLSLLEGYDWPGNVRELRNVIERGSVMQRTGESSWLELILGGKPKTRAEDPRSVLQLAAQMSYADAKDRVMLDFDRHYFEQVLKECKNDVKAAMARTGLSLPSLYRLFKRVGIRIKDLRNTEG